MTLEIYTLVHVAISLVGIASGFAVLFGLLAGKRLDGWTKLFLITTVATSVTGFLFPFHGFTPAIGVGIISLVVLAVAIFARYGRNLAGSWRWIYVVTAMIALYLNVFVGIVQAFQKVPALKAIAPMQTEPPFAVTQLVVLVLFILIGLVAAIRFRPELTRAM
jgi:magnesium-transporting ATPase (P-type)